MNTQLQYANALVQISRLTQKNTVKIIFFANNKSTSNEFIANALHQCKTNKKKFIVFYKDDLIQILSYYKKTNQTEEEVTRNY